MGNGMIRTLIVAAILGAILAYGFAGALDHAESVGEQYKLTTERDTGE